MVGWPSQSPLGETAFSLGYVAHGINETKMASDLGEGLKIGGEKKPGVGIVKAEKTKRTE